MPSLPSEERTDVVDLAVVGAGPAGLSAAVAAADAGLRVAVLDLGDRVGGQYYRHGACATGPKDPGTHHHWSRFVRLRARFEAHVQAGRIDHLARHAVWSVDKLESFVVRATVDERRPVARIVKASKLVVATGAHDRHVPFPGWTLPGVMAAGGAQALLKGSRVVPGRRVVVAGTGPFLLAVADGLIAAGAEVPAVVEVNSPSGYARRPVAVAGAYRKIPEMFGYGARMIRHRVPYLVRSAITAAQGAGRLESVTVTRVDEGWRPVPGGERTIACDALAVGYGFIPQIELLLSLGSDSRLAPDGSLAITTDPDQRTSVDGVYAAGETAGIGGADVAELEGTLAGAAVVRDLTGAPALAEREARHLRVRRRRLRRFAYAMQEVHAIRDGWTGWLDETTVVCRCEEVSHGRIREAVCELGATSPRVVKLLSRPGMGWCQGRMCAMPTATITAGLLDRAVTQRDLEGLVHRTIAQPVPLAMLATAGEAEERA